MLSNKALLFKSKLALADIFFIRLRVRSSFYGTLGVKIASAKALTEVWVWQTFQWTR